MAVYYLERVYDIPAIAEFNKDDTESFLIWRPILDLVRFSSVWNHLQGMYSRAQK